jgi:hypothetical protein
MSKAAPKDAKLIYPWPRFWCPREGMLDLSDGGFLSDPTSHIWRGAQPQPKTLDELADHRALVLLGEPGLGKSTALANEMDRVGASTHGGVVSMREDLRAFSSEELFYRRIFDNPTFRAWEDGDSHLVLHLDSLDEALLRIDSIANLLADELPRRPHARLSLRIACRTAVWPGGILEPALTGLWGEAGVGVFELAPLRRIDVNAAAKLRGIDPDAFIRALFEADAVPFAIKPLTLNLLFDIFARDGRLPHSTGEIYRKGGLLLCEETNASRRGARRTGTLNPEQRLRTAGRIAAATMLANRYAVWTGIESGSVPPQDVVISALAGGREEGGFPGFDVGEPHIREVLDTGLFTARGPEEMGWAHQSYAEFLAAQYLVDREVSPDNILKVLTHPSGGLVPQLAVVAAWIASLSAPVRDALIQNEPFVLLRADLSAWSPSDIEALTGAFLKALDEKRATDLMIGIASFYPRLAHPNLDVQLRAYFTDTGKFIMSRRAAIMIAGACKRTGLQADLLSLTLDPAQDAGLRASALAAIRDMGGNGVAAQLLGFVNGTAGNDPHEEMRGYALQILWPNHITAADLFNPLVAPDEGYVGSYIHFLNYILPDSLSVASLPAALGWARGYIASAGYIGGFHLKSLADSIMVHAWAHMDDDATRSSLVAYLRTALSQAGEMLRGTDHRMQQKFREALADDDGPRRRLMHAMLQARVERIDAFHYRRAGLLQTSDLAWLLSLAPGGSASDALLDRESLCNAVEVTCDLYTPAQFDKIYDAAERWSLLRTRFQGVFDGVLLDSRDAQQARQYQEMSKTYSQPAPAISPPPSERVANDLKNFEAGNWRAFWHLNIDLMLTPTSPAFSDLDYVITAMPGWGDADAGTRLRIMRAAEQYLSAGKTSVAGWIGTNRYKRNDLAAFRALILLKQHDSAAYARIPDDVWRKWAPAIAAIPQRFEDDTPAEVKMVLADAVAKAPAAFVRAVRTLIRRERTRAAKNAAPVHHGASFLALRNLEPCWQSVPLCESVLAELKDPSNTADQFAVLADTLLAAPFLPARDDLRAQLHDGTLTDSDKAVAAANALATHALLASWPVLWDRLQADSGFARTFFLTLALRYAFRESIFSELPERALADIYVLLERIFLRKDDPVQQGGRVHAVGAHEQVTHLRDRLPGELAARATPDAVAALRWAVTELPDVTGLIFTLRKAEQLMRMRTWAPLSVAEVRRLTRDRKSVLVQSPDDLIALLVGALREYERQLHGETPTIRGLWDRQGGGKTYRPVEEDALSDDVKRFLQRELADSGIVVNREVEIGRVPGAPVGKRTDIRVQAIRRGPDSEPLDTLVAVIETKGCWNAQLFSALKDQLHDDYLVRLAAPVGIYLVGWFDKTKWDAKDGRKAATPNISPAEARQRLDDQARAIPAGSIVRAVVIDCRLP